MAAHLKDQPPPAPAVEIEPWLGWVWRCWHRLHLDRPHLPGGMGPPVPRRLAWIDLAKWCDLYGYDREQLDFLDFCTSHMDEVYLTKWNEDERHRQAMAKLKGRS